MARPVIGITVDNKANSVESGQYESAIAYSRAVADAGGVPLLLPQRPELADEYAALCDGFMLTGGADAHMQTFGKPMHAMAKPMAIERQAFELALMAAADRFAEKPQLGICMGMQMMALHRGGDLHQHLPDILGEPVAASHVKNNRHRVSIDTANAFLAANDAAVTTVVSSHHQAVKDAGTLRVIARSEDGVVEAVDDPARPFYLGVQWHPERGGDDALSLGLIARFVRACRRGTAAR